jgi:hypothetical protein
VTRCRSVVLCGVVAIAGACGAPIPSPSASAPGPTVPPSAAPAATSPSAPASEVASPSVGPSTSPAIDPTRFTSTVDNPWFPLTPGTTLTYRGTKDGKPAVDIVTVTSETILIDGVPCRVIRDRLFLDGELEERTADYYTQDVDGTVWYFGEDTAELDENGKVTSTEGTWRTGVDGASPGIFMEATPVVGHTFTQELYPGHAEDHFEVVSLSATITVPLGTFRHALRTKEWTPLEPDVIDNKYYVRGIGEVREVTVKGPREELFLVRVKRP